MKRILSCGALGAAASLVLAVQASAHVTLERRSVAPGAPYRGVLQVNHGCSGAATTAISVTIPPDVIGVRPMPKPGWSLDIRREPYAKPVRVHGETVTEGPREITWSGGTIPDDQYDEFVFVAQIAGDHPAGTTLYLPVLQTCGAASSNWAQEPPPGQETARLPYPAPALRVVAQAGSGETGGAAMDHDMSMHGHDAGGPPASAGATVRVGALTIENPWMRATPAGAKVAGGYLRITNAGSEPDRLIGASVPLARRGEVHEMTMDGGVMKMHEVEGGLEIRPGQTVELKPGGYHLMFMDLTGAPRQGESVKGTLTFARAGTVSVTFPVAPIGAAAPAGK